MEVLTLGVHLHVCAGRYIHTHIMCIKHTQRDALALRFPHTYVQIQQAADENWDPDWQYQVWKCESTKSLTTIGEYASYQYSVEV